MINQRESTCRALDDGTCPVISGRPLDDPDGLCPLCKSSVLVVDDNGPVRRINTLTVERMGMPTHAASSGQEALAIFEQHGDELAVAMLDIEMPGMDGFELCENIRRQRPDLPVVFLSGCAAPNLTEKIEQLQPAHFIHKPCPIRDMRRFIGGLLCPVLAG